MFQIVRTHRVRVQLNTSEIHNPCEPCGIIHDNFFRSPAGGKGQCDRTYPARAWSRSTLLIEGRFIGTVDKTLQDNGPVCNAPQRSFCNRQVVPDEIHL
jgi:hypothetical protein